MTFSAKRFLSATVAAMILVGTFAACSKAAPASSVAPASSAAPAASSAAAPAASTPEEAKPVYPMDTKTKLTWWMTFQSNYSTYATNFGEIDFAKNFSKMVGVEVEYIQPPMGKDREQFNIMVASGDLPDIIEWRWTTDYPGGSTAAIADGVIIELNDAIEKWAPAYTKYLADRPEFKKQVVTDNGQHFVFPFVRGDNKLKTTSGPILRKDWLDDLGMAAPETIEEWKAVLTAFKEKKGAAAPFVGQTTNNDPMQLYNTFLSAYGVRVDFYIDVDTNKVKYGFIEPAFKDFLTEMADWYKAGLIDPNFLTADRKLMDSNILGGTSGACYGPGGGGLGPWITTAKQSDPNTTYDLVATPFPVLKKGDKIQHAGTSYDYATTSPGSAAITTKCKDVETATKALDFAFTEEGHMLYNFGIEGESYTMVNGIPTYTDLINKNPDGLNFAQALSKYSRANTNGPFEQHEQYIIQFYAMDQQKNALAKWADTLDAKNMYTLEPPISMTTDESAEDAKLRADMDTYRREMVAKFITGAESLDKFDSYVEQMKTLGTERCIALHQAAYDRYIKR